VSKLASERVSNASTCDGARALMREVRVRRSPPPADVLGVPDVRVWECSHPGHRDPEAAAVEDAVVLQQLVHLEVEELPHAHQYHGEDHSRHRWSAEEVLGAIQRHRPLRRRGQARPDKSGQAGRQTWAEGGNNVVSPHIRTQAPTQIHAQVTSRAYVRACATGQGGSCQQRRRCPQRRGHDARRRRQMRGSASLFGPSHARTCATLAA
jgi:hypothetical protein